MKVGRATILVCTYNRAHLLRETLAAIQALDRPRECEVEVIVVDNNSTDGTAAVVHEAAASGSLPIVYVHEARQGKSFALNTGLARSGGDIVALTDDDVLPAKDWLQRIVTAFREREVTFVGGSVLPRWEHRPPPELWTPAGQDLWGPLALVDYGAPITYVAESTIQRLPIGANVSFVRSALVRIGGWRTDLGKVNNSLISGEDHEIFSRLRAHGLYAGVYDPEIAVRHYVPAERLTRRYFRRWFYWHGKTQALMIDELFPDDDMARIPRILGVPRFLYRQTAGQLWRWLRGLGGRDALAVLTHELKLLESVGLLGESWRRCLLKTRPRIRAQAQPAATELLGR